MIRALQIAAITLTSVFLAAVVGFVLMEKTWVGKEPDTPEGHFLYGSTGTELMPLPVFQVLPDIFPDQFQSAGKQAGDWVDQFGFVRGKEGVNEGLPLGMNVSYYRPKSGAPSPVLFVGFNCAACHTAKIRRFPGDEGMTVYGMGNPAIDLVAFGEAVKSSLLDEQRRRYTSGGSSPGFSPPARPLRSASQASWRRPGPGLAWRGSRAGRRCPA